jgi:hypothetical protein
MRQSTMLKMITALMKSVQGGTMFQVSVLISPPTALAVEVMRFPNSRGAWDWVVGVPFGTRILGHDGRLGVPLPGQILEFGDPRIRVLVRIVNNRRLLVPLGVDDFVPEVERTVRQLTVAEIEKFVDATGLDHLPIWDDTLNLPIVSVEHELDVRMVQHPLEHSRITMERHRLIRVSKVAVVAVRADWHTRDN